MTSLTHDAAAVSVEIGDGFLTLGLRDGRRISAPLEQFPRLNAATEADRAEWRIVGAGEGVHWPRIDEDISVAGLLAV